MTEDWASRFRPNDEAEPEEKIEQEVVEIMDEPSSSTDQPTIADVNEILISLKNIDERITADTGLILSRFTALENLIANPPWLNDLNTNLQAVLRDNAAALVGANNQFMAILARKMDEMEERLSSDDPSFTNILYSNPELFTEISKRPDENEPYEIEEEFAAINKIAEMVDEKHPDLLVDDDKEDAVEVAFKQWQEKEIKWSDFVKAAGGVKAASDYKKQQG